MILNWHEGNIPSLAIAAEALHREHGMTVLTVQACYVAEELYGGSCNGLTHGGEIEALAVLANRPELVHLDRIDNSSDHSHGHRMDKLRRTRSYQPVLTDIRSIAPTGWFGAPQHANAEKGAPHGGRYRRRHRPRGRRHLPSARCGAGRHRRNQAAAGRWADGACCSAIRQSQAAGTARAHLARAGVGRDRLARDLSASPKSRCRRPATSRAARTCIDEFEECIYVLSGEGRTLPRAARFPIKPGDIVLIPPGEKHMTRNTGTVPLVLLCFFPVPDITARTTEFPSF